MFTPIRILLLLGAMVSCSLFAQGRGDRPANVITAPVQFEYAEQRIEAVGNAQALQSVTLYPAVAERVTAVNFRPGDRVSSEQILVELDARAEKVEVARSEILLQDAERTVTRLTDSRKQGAIPQSELDNAITLRDLARIQLQQAKVALEDRLVRAPFDGIVGLTEVEVGDRISTQTVITHLDNREQLYVRFTIPEAGLSLLQQQASVTLRPWREGQATISASIAEIDSRIDPVDRTLAVRALIDNPQDIYRPGMSFRVDLILRGERYAAIPEAALQWGATGAYIWLVEHDKAQRVDVQIKQRLRGRLLVEGEIPAGATLIQEGVQTVREGQTVINQTQLQARQ